jgi:hypothetical protein
MVCCAQSIRYTVDQRSIEYLQHFEASWIRPWITSIVCISNRLGRGVDVELWEACQRVLPGGRVA